MAKNLVSLQVTHDCFFEDSSLIGIASPLPSYKLCWVLNNHFDISFSRESEYDIEVKKMENVLVYPYYNYQINDSTDIFRLYNLKFGVESLLPELKHIDYIWFIQSIDHRQIATKFIYKLKLINEISFSQLIELDQIKKINNLLV